MNDLGHEPDSEVIAASIDGDVERRTELYHRYSERLRTLLRCRFAAAPEGLRRRLGVEDLLQDAWVRIYDRLAEYQPDRGPFVLWARQICLDQVALAYRHNKAQKRDFDREQGQVARSTDRTDYFAVQLAGRLTSASHAFHRKELAEQVSRALQQLDDVDREILMLRHFEELSNQSVSELLGLSKQATAMRHRRALQRIARLLKFGSDDHKMSDDHNVSNDDNVSMGT